MVKLQGRCTVREKHSTTKSKISVVRATCCCRVCFRGKSIWKPTKPCPTLTPKTNWSSNLPSGCSQRLAGRQRLLLRKHSARAEHLVATQREMSHWFPG